MTPGEKFLHTFSSNITKHSKKCHQTHNHKPKQISCNLASVCLYSPHRSCDCPHTHTHTHASCNSHLRAEMCSDVSGAVGSHECVPDSCLCVRVRVCVCVCVFWRNALIWQSWSNGWSQVQLIWLDVDPTGLVSSNMLPVSSCNPAQNWVDTHNHTHAITPTHTLIPCKEKRHISMHLLTYVSQRCACHQNT